jgi:hypothetical protein
MIAPTTKTKASDTELLLAAVDQMQSTQEEHTTILTTLEARPILDLAGIERRLDELADTITKQTAPAPPPSSQRRWWLVPSLVTLAAVAGAAVMLLVLQWRVSHASVSAKPPVTQSPARRSR